jgi:hypothetical protein
MSMACHPLQDLRRRRLVLAGHPVSLASPPQRRRGAMTGPSTRRGSVLIRRSVTIAWHLRQQAGSALADPVLAAAGLRQAHPDGKPMQQARSLDSKETGCAAHQAKPIRRISSEARHLRSLIPS